mmetsp:Transcript_15200/g.36161  ORF Transcript_15200/g.36161 Transcript_15200/m.36161 type:complete len:167 (+) Transcript_15200:100-600(+)
MGRGQKRKARTMKRDFKEQRSNEWRYEKRVKQDDGTWGEQTFKNDDFEEYYRAQSIVPEEHWEEFLETLRSTLPTTFRINGSNKYAGELIRKMENDLVSQFNSQPIEVSPESITSATMSSTVSRATVRETAMILSLFPLASVMRTCLRGHRTICTREGPQPSFPCM